MLKSNKDRKTKKKMNHQEIKTKGQLAKELASLIQKYDGKNCCNCPKRDKFIAQLQNHHP